MWYYLYGDWTNNEVTRGQKVTEIGVKWKFLWKMHNSTCQIHIFSSMRMPKEQNQIGIIQGSARYPPAFERRSSSEISRECAPPSHMPGQHRLWTSRRIWTIHFKVLWGKWDIQVLEHLSTPGVSSWEPNSEWSWGKLEPSSTSHSTSATLVCCFWFHELLEMVLPLPWGHEEAAWDSTRSAFRVYGGQICRKTNNGTFQSGLSRPCVGTDYQQSPEKCIRNNW